MPRAPSQALVHDARLASEDGDRQNDPREDDLKLRLSESEYFIYRFVRESDELFFSLRDGLYVSFMPQIVENAPGILFGSLARLSHEVLHNLILCDRTCPEP